MRILHLLLAGCFSGIECNLDYVIKSFRPGNEHIVAYACDSAQGDYAGTDVFRKKFCESTLIERQSRINFSSFDAAALEHNVNDIIDLINKTNPDVLHVPKEEDFLPAYLASVATGVPFLPVLHQSPTTTCVFYQFAPLYKKMLKDTRFSAVSEYAGKAFLKRFGCESETAYVLRDAADSTLFKNDLDVREKIRSDYAIPADALVIGFCGRLLPIKQPDWVIDAIAFIKEKNPNQAVYGFFLGTPSPGHDYKKYAQLKGVDGCIIWAGFHYPTEPFYNAFDFFVLPSEDDACPMVVLTALTAQLPIVITTPYEPSGTLYDGYGIITNGVNGIVVNTNNKQLFLESVNELVSSVSLQKKYTDAIPLSLEKFLPGRVAENYHEMFEKLILEKKPANKEKYESLLALAKDLSKKEPVL